MDILKTLGFIPYEWTLMGEYRKFQIIVYHVNIVSTLGFFFSQEQSKLNTDDDKFLISQVRTDNLVNLKLGVTHYELQEFLEFIPESLADELSYHLDLFLE